MRYKASGVRGAWFYSSKARKAPVAFDKDTPAFALVPVVVGEVPTVQRFGVSLPEFVAAMLNKRLVWTVPEYSSPIQIEFLTDICWACSKPIKQVFGYFQSENIEDEDEEDKVGWHERALTVASLSTALKGVQDIVSNEELVAAGLNPIGQQNVIHGKPTNWPHCNLCIHCRAPQNNFHIGEKLHIDMYGVAPVIDDGSVEQRKEVEISARLIGRMPFPRTVMGIGYWAFNPTAAPPTAQSNSP